MAGVVHALFVEYCFRVALVDVVMWHCLRVAMMATFEGMPPGAAGWDGSVAPLCLSLAKAGLVAAIGGGCGSPHGGRAPAILHLQGWLMSLPLCGGCAHFSPDTFGHLSDMVGPLSDSPDRASLRAQALACQIACSLLGYLWACSCFGRFVLERREAIALGKARKVVPLSPSHVETFALGPDAPGDWDTACVICFDGFAEGCLVGRLPCGHKFHDGCIREWLGIKDRCPMRCTVHHCAPVVGRPSEP